MTIRIRLLRGFLVAATFLAISASADVVHARRETRCGVSFVPPPGWRTGHATSNDDTCEFVMSVGRRKADVSLFGRVEAGSLGDSLSGTSANRFGYTFDGRAGERSEALRMTGTQEKTVSGMVEVGDYSNGGYEGMAEASAAGVDSGSGRIAMFYGSTSLDNARLFDRVVRSVRFVQRRPRARVMPHDNSDSIHHGISVEMRWAREKLDDWRRTLQLLVEPGTNKSLPYPFAVVSEPCTIQGMQGERDLRNPYVHWNSLITIECGDKNSPDITYNVGLREDRLCVWTAPDQCLVQVELQNWVSLQFTPDSLQVTR